MKHLVNNVSYPVSRALILTLALIMTLVWNNVLAEESLPKQDLGEIDHDTAFEAATERATPKVAKIKIEGVIDQRQLRYIKRALTDAQAQGATTILSHISSPGGELFAAIETLEFLTKAARKHNLRMAAWVEDEAYSAAALLAYGHKEVYLRPDAIIGNIGIIFQGPDGQMEYAPEKIETALRTILDITAERSEWDSAQLVKMTARNQDLYEARFPDGRKVMVIEDNKGRFLADNPEINPEDPSQWILVLGEDRLLTFSGTKAMASRMATGLKANIEEVYEVLGTSSDSIIDLSPTDLELTARTMGGFAPLFIGLAVVFLFLELKSPGIGIFAILSASCAVIFFVMQYYQDLAGNWEIVLIALGIVLILVEVFTMITGGILAAVGGLMLFGGIFGAFIPSGFSWDFAQESNNQAIQSALSDFAISLAIIVFGGVAAILIAPKLPFIHRVSASGSITSTSDDGASNHLDFAASDNTQRGTITGECHPSGTVLVDGKSHSARAINSTFIETGSEVEIIGQEFGELLVRPITGSAATDDSDTQGART